MSSGFQGQEVDRSWESPWNRYSTLLPHQTKALITKVQWLTAEQWPPEPPTPHPQNSRGTVWPPLSEGDILTTVTEVTLVTPVLKSSDSRWGVAQSWHTSQVHSRLCASSQHWGGKKSIKSGDSPWRLLNKQLFTPGHVLSTRILKHDLKNDMPCLAKFI